MKKLHLPNQQICCHKWPCPFQSQTLFIPDLWISDLLNSNYEDIPTVKISSDPLYPCIEQDALSGVYFAPSVLTTPSQDSKEASRFYRLGPKLSFSKKMAHYRPLFLCFYLFDRVDRNIIIIISFKSNGPMPVWIDG